MKLLHTLANHLRSQEGEKLTIEMLRAELEEVKQLCPKTTVGKADKNRHILALQALINYKQNRQQ